MVRSKCNNCGAWGRDRCKCLVPVALPFIGVVYLFVLFLCYRVLAKLLCEGSGWVLFSMVFSSLSIFQRYKYQNMACKAVKKEQTKQTDVDKKIRLEELKLRKAEAMKEYEAMKAQRKQEEKVPWSKPRRWNKSHSRTWHHSNDGCWTAHDEYLRCLDNDGVN